MHKENDSYKTMVTKQNDKIREIHSLTNNARLSISLPQSNRVQYVPFYVGSIYFRICSILQAQNSFHKKKKCSKHAK